MPDVLLPRCLTMRCSRGACSDRVTPCCCQLSQLLRCFQRDAHPSAALVLIGRPDPSGGYIPAPDRSFGNPLPESCPSCLPVQTLRSSFVLPPDVKSAVPSFSGSSAWQTPPAPASGGKKSIFRLNGLHLQHRPAAALAPAQHVGEDLGRPPCTQLFTGEALTPANSAEASLLSGFCTCLAIASKPSACAWAKAHPLGVVVGQHNHADARTAGTPPASLCHLRLLGIGCCGWSGCCRMSKISLLFTLPVETSSCGSLGCSPWWGKHCIPG